MKTKIISNGSGERRNILGDNQIIKLSSEDTDGAFIMFEQSNQPGVGVPLHVHQNDDELFYIIEGSIEFKLQGRSIIADQGTTVLLPRGIPHEFMTVGDYPAKTLVSVFPAGIEGMFDELKALLVVPPDMPTVLEICGRYGITFLAPSDPIDDNLAAI